MKNAAFHIFKQAPKCGSLALVCFNLAIGLIFTVVDASAQRVCESDANAIAKIDPCTGPSGTAITVTMMRTSARAASRLVFKRELTNATRASVTIPVSKGRAVSTSKLCVNGAERWEVWIIDGAGRSRGKIGVFWPDCSETTGEEPVNAEAKTGQIDRCLVGSWVSGLSTALDGSSGMSGVKLVINLNGSIILTYRGMEPRKTYDETGRLLGSESWDGEGTGRISTDSGQIFITKQASSDVSRVVTANGNSRTNPVLSLAPVLVSAPYIVRYTCKEGSLRITTSANGVDLLQFNFAKKEL